MQDDSDERGMTGKANAVTVCDTTLARSEQQSAVRPLLPDAAPASLFGTASPSVTAAGVSALMERGRARVLAGLCVLLCVLQQAKPA